MHAHPSSSHQLESFAILPFVHVCCLHIMLARPSTILRRLTLPTRPLQTTYRVDIRGYYAGKGMEVLRMSNYRYNNAYSCLYTILLAMMSIWFLTDPSRACMASMDSLCLRDEKEAGRQILIDITSRQSGLKIKGTAYPRTHLQSWPLLPWFRHRQINMRRVAIDIIESQDSIV